MELSDERLVTTQDRVSSSFSYDGYELLHDDAMDQISVSIHYSDYDGNSNVNSRNNLTVMNESQEKKIKISLSQEQLKLNTGTRNYLSVPRVTRKFRSTSFSTDQHDESESFEAAIKTKSAALEIAVPNFRTPPEDEIVYAVPCRQQAKEANEIKIASVSLTPSIAPSTSSTAELSKNFKFPLSFYCKICNDIFNDPRLLDCLHSFCMQCLAKLDATNDLQNNQFWRKISDSSCEFEHNLTFSLNVKPSCFSLIS